MFVRVSTVILAIAAGLLAVPGTAADLMPASQCNASNLKCCDSTTTVANAGDMTSGLLGLGLNLDDILGLNCVTIPVLGSGIGANCAQQPVCCTNVQQNGLVNVGCTPVNLAL